jgi:D-inositol-3-phosphate glycosyltransferase
MSKKPVLLIISYFEPGTGFFSVIKNLAGQLHHDFDIHYVGIGFHGKPTAMDYWTLYPGGFKNSEFSIHQSCRLANKLTRGHILLVNDFFVLGAYQRSLAALKPRWKILAYVPLDGILTNDELLLNSSYLDTLVVYTKFAKAEIEQHKAFIARSNSNFHYPPIEIIPHGLDNSFHRFNQEQKQAARKIVFAEEPSWWSDFIVLNANRFSERKRLDLTLKAFEDFSQDKDNVRLYLHQGLITGADYQALSSLAKKYNISNKVKISRPGREVCSQRTLNLVYNSCDVGINTSVGEGWGLVSFEHAATGAAQIIPAHSACKELWTGHAEMIDISGQYRPGIAQYNLMSEPDPISASRGLNRLYHDKNYLQLISSTSYDAAIHETYQWAAIGRQWRSLLQRL